MQARLITTVLGCALVAAFDAHLTAQSLSLSFRDHDGTVTEDASFPVLRTGSLVGTVDLPVSDPLVLDYVWGFYADGELCYAETAPGGETRSHYTFAPEGGGKMVVDGGKGRVELPYGYDGYMQLPVGGYSLRLWLGRPGEMQVDEFTGEVVRGALYDLRAPVAVESVPFAVHTWSPRRIEFDEEVVFRVITEDPVERDTYFTVTAPEGVGELSVSQVLIPAGSTASADFLFVAPALRVEGALAAIRDDGVQMDSPMLRIEPNSNFVTEGSVGVTLPPDDGWAYCSTKAKPISYGAGGERCSKDCDNPAPAADEMCLVTPGLARAQWTVARCSFAFTTDCQFYTDTLMLNYYTAEPTYLKPCGATTTEVEIGGSIGIGRRGVGARIGGEYENSDTELKFMTCCKIKFDQRKPKKVAQCRTV